MLGKLSFRLFELDLIRARVDFHQAIALVNELPFLEVNPRDLSVHAAANRHGVKCGNGAKPVEVNRKIAAQRGGDDHRYNECTRSLAALAPAASAGR